MKARRFAVRPDPTTDCGVSCPRASRKKKHRHIIGKTMIPLCLSCFDQIFFILTGNDDMHKSLDELEIRPYQTTKYRVSCP